MQWRAHVTSIGLTIAAAGALAYAYLDRGSVTESEKKAREGSVFGAWRREALTRIVVDRGGEHIVLERSKDDAGDAEWWMRAPLVERADDETCDRLASAFELASVVRKVAGDVHAPGFDAPRAQGEIDMGAVTYRFALGGDAPTPAGGAYLRVDGVGTVVVGREIVTQLSQASDTYRSRSFVPYVSVQLAGLEIKGEKDLRIERVDDVSFKLVPSGLRASRAKLDDVWGALGEMRAEAFVTDAVADPLVASPRLTITMTPAPRGGSSATPGAIRVGGECPGHPEDVVVVRDAPTRLAACAPKGVLSGLETTPDALVDSHLFAAHADEVAELRLEGLASGGAVLELARKEDGWRERAPESRDLPAEEASAATALVAAIAGAEGTDPHKVEEGTFDAKWRVTLRRAESGKGEGGVAEIVELGVPDAAGDAVARRALDGARLHVGAAIVRELIPRAVALRGADVWQPPVEGFPVSAIATRCDGVEQTVVHDAGSWTIRAPTGFAADNASVIDLIDAVTGARADGWVADADDGRFGLDGACSIALTIDGDGGERVVRIDFGKAGEGGVYAKTNAFPGVFVASPALRDRARSWLVDLHGLTPANLAEVTLARDGRRFVFFSDAGTDEAADALIAAVTVLRADSVVHLGPAKEAEGFARPSLVITTRADGDGGASKAGRLVFGAETADAKSRFLRVDGVDATFAVDKDRVKALFERF